MLRAMCRKETDEEYLIGYAKSPQEANDMIDRHLSDHPEDCVWIEEIVGEVTWTALN